MFTFFNLLHHKCTYKEVQSTYTICLRYCILLLNMWLCVCFYKYYR